MPTRRMAMATGLAWAAIGTPALAAEAPDNRVTQFMSAGRYLPLLLQTRTSPEQHGAGFNQQYASLVGDEATALAAAAPTADLGTLPPDARAVDAIARIVDAARDRRVVMLNEAHNCSRHRSFLAEVLRALRPLGFTHLAAEDFLHSTDPTAPDIRKLTVGGRLIPGSGFYQRDPVYAEAIREAADLGYRFVPYESRNDQRRAEDDQDAQIARREEAQADNLIANVLKPDPAARVLVYVGYAHLRETPDSRGARWFASRLAGKTGLDPLTIGQSITGAFKPHGRDNALTSAVLERFAPTASIVVEGSVLAERMGSDLAVFHPPLEDVAGRPGWLAADSGRKAVTVPLPAVRGPFLVQAIHAGEPEVCIPADHYPPPDGAREATFFLRPGPYEVRLETQEGFQPLQKLSV